MPQTYPECVFIDVQDFFHQHQIIVNGIDNRPAMMGGYMSVIDQSAFNEHSAEMLDAFCAEALAEAATSFRERGYLGVIWTAAAILIEDLLERTKTISR